MTTKTEKSKKRFDYSGSAVKLKRNQLYVAKLRGYELNEDEERFLEDPSEFPFQEETLEELLSKTYTKVEDGIRYTLQFVFFDVEKDIGGPAAEKILQVYKDYPSTYTVIFINFLLTSIAKVRVNSSRCEMDTRLEFWSIIDLYVNPFEHFACPEQTLLTQEEINRELPLAVSQDEKKKKHFLQSLGGMCNDKIAKWFGADIGAIIRVERDSLYGGKLPFYRIVRRMNFGVD